MPPVVALAIRLGAAAVWLIAGSAKAVELTGFQALVMALVPALLLSLDRPLLGRQDRFWRGA